jgi:hypothetical protein
MCKPAIPDPRNSLVSGKITGNLKNRFSVPRACRPWPASTRYNHAMLGLKIRPHDVAKISGPVIWNVHGTAFVHYVNRAPLARQPRGNRSWGELQNAARWHRPGPKLARIGQLNQILGAPTPAVEQIEAGDALSGRFRRRRMRLDARAMSPTPQAR